MTNTNEDAKVVVAVHVHVFQNWVLVQVSLETRMMALFISTFLAYNAMPMALTKRSTDVCGSGVVHLPAKNNFSCGTCVKISCGKNTQTVKVGTKSPNNIVYINSNVYKQLCGSSTHATVYWKPTPCSITPTPAPNGPPKSTSPVKLYKPVVGEVWKRGQASNAVVEWLQGSNPVPTNYPKYLSVYFVDLKLKEVYTITSFHEPKWSRWIFGYQVGTNLNLVPNLPDGQYYIKACDSQNLNSCTFSNVLQINGQVDSLKFQVVKPAANDVWKRGQNGPVIEWLSGPVPTGYPSSINIYILDAQKKRVFTVATYNPSSNLKWTFGYAVGSNPNLVPSLPDGDYYVQIVDANNADMAAASATFQIKGQQ